MLTPEQVNEFISKAVLDSQIGVAVQESVKRVIAELTKTYNNPFDVVIKKHVDEEIERILRTVYADQIEIGVKAAMAKVFTAEYITKIADAGLERLRNTRY